MDTKSLNQPTSRAKVAGALGGAIAAEAIHRHVDIPQQLTERTVLKENWMFHACRNKAIENGWITDDMRFGWSPTTEMRDYITFLFPHL